MENYIFLPTLYEIEKKTKERKKKQPEKLLYYNLNDERTFPQ